MYFARQLQALAQANKVRMLDTGEVHRLTVRRLYMLISDNYPELRLSQTHFYRYYHGQHPPRLDLVLALSHLFGVSPGHFLVDPTEQSCGLN